MLSRKPLGVVGAVMLGITALLGTNAANAAISLDGEDMGGVTYAQETITQTLQGRDGVTHYVVDGGDSALDVNAALGFATAQGASLIVRYDFNGMILTETSTPELSVAGTAAILRQGGEAKDDYVVFLFTRVPTDGLTNAAVLVLTLEDVAISAGGGSIAMHSTDTLSIPAENRASHSGAVRMASAPMPVKVPMDQTALVSEKFLSFAGAVGELPVQVVTLGSVMLNAVTPGLLNAQDGLASPAIGELLALGDAAVDMPGTESTATFTGDFSFVSRAWLDTAVECEGTGDLRMDEDSETMMRDTTQLKPQSVTYLNANPFLCIMVLPATDEMAVPIPTTAPYMVEKKIVLNQTDFADSKFVPMPAPAPLGAIMRDGTTVHIPYLTKFADYNQRIVIVNRGGAAEYALSFMTEDGVMATPGADAEGTLAANATTYLSLKNHDLVTIEGPFNRVSGTLIVESQPQYIDVVVSQTNVDGGTDTVKYTPND